jgi:hypothetical protein
MPSEQKSFFPRDQREKDLNNIQLIALKKLGEKNSARRLLFVVIFLSDSVLG